MACLCLGPPSSGKTLLLKRLQTSTVSDITSTVETVGTNIVPVPRKMPTTDKDKQKKNVDGKDFIEIREIGKRT
jgi:GTPase SAR1 family protein